MTPVNCLWCGFTLVEGGGKLQREGEGSPQKVIEVKGMLVVVVTMVVMV